MLVADAAATAVCEKALDGAAMFLLAAPAAWLLPDLPSWVTTTIIVGALVVAGTLATLAVAARRAIRDDGWLARFRAGMEVLRAPRRAAAVLGLLVLAWLVDVAMVELVIHAFHIALSPAAALIVLVAVNLAIAVPAMPAQVGIHEAGALARLAVVHVSLEPAIAFALMLTTDPGHPARRDRPRARVAPGARPARHPRDIPFRACATQLGASGSPDARA